MSELETVQPLLGQETLLAPKHAATLREAAGLQRMVLPARYRELEDAGRIKWRRLAGGVELPQVERDFCGAIVNGLSADGTTIDVIASDETKDRYGDVISAAGWKLQNYRKNPVILVDHDYSVESIVGRAKRVWVENHKLMIRIVLADDDIAPKAKLVRGLLRHELLRTVSVGFLPLAWERIEDKEGNWTGGFRYLEQELLEDSFVAVPANPNATVNDSVDPEQTAASDSDRDQVREPDDAAVLKLALSALGSTHALWARQLAAKV